MAAAKNGKLVDGGSSSEWEVEEDVRTEKGRVPELRYDCQNRGVLLSIDWDKGDKCTLS